VEEHLPTKPEALSSIPNNTPQNNNNNKSGKTPEIKFKILN
jgi:hypothetical protein